MHVSSFQLGPLELKNILLCESFANPEVMGIPDDIDIILGYGALAARQFWLDGPGNALYFSRETPDDAEKKCEGIRIIDDLFFQFIDKERI